MAKKRNTQPEETAENTTQDTTQNTTSHAVKASPEDLSLVTVVPNRVWFDPITSCELSDEEVVAMFGVPFFDSLIDINRTEIEDQERVAKLADLAAKSPVARVVDPNVPTFAMLKDSRAKCVSDAGWFKPVEGAQFIGYVDQIREEQGQFGVEKELILADGKKTKSRVQEVAYLYGTMRIPENIPAKRAAIEVSGIIKMTITERTKILRDYTARSQLLYIEAVGREEDRFDENGVKIRSGAIIYGISVIQKQDAQAQASS